jgi:predicted aconitase with swiveling domain
LALILQPALFTEYHHQLENVSIKTRSTTFPQRKRETTGGCLVVYQLAVARHRPHGDHQPQHETIIAVGAIMGGIPVVDPLEKILFRSSKPATT